MTNFTTDGEEGEDNNIGGIPVWAIIIIASILIIIGCCVKLCISVIQSLVKTGSTNEEF